MRKHGGTPSRRDKHVTLAAISPPGVARGRFVGGQQSGLAGSKPPPLFTREASSCSSQGRRQGEPWGASPRPSAPTYLPALPACLLVRVTAASCGQAPHGNASGHAARITDWRTLSWSSGAAHPPGGTSWFSPSLRSSTASKGRFLIPLVVPELAQPYQTYTSTTRGRASSPRGSETVPQSRSQG